MRWRILLIAGAVALVGLAIGFWASVKTKKPPPVTYMGRPIPPEGLVIDSQSKDPGDPRNAEEDFRRLYAAMTAYRAKTGKLPNPGQLMQMTGEEVEGISLRPEDLQNPDALKAEGPSARLRNRRKFEYMAAWARPRYDGRPKPAQPPEGERDVWIVSNHYARSNGVAYADKPYRYHFTGCWVVLWSDGAVERVPYKDLLMYEQSPNMYGYVIPGEAGAPKNPLPITEWWKQRYGPNASWE